jgi:S1-C subfamily serine protease
VNLVLAALLLQAGGDDPAEVLARVLERLRERVAKSVVALDVDRSADPEGTGAEGAVAAHRDYYNRPRGPVSGVVYEADGFILTSAFNVSGTIRRDGIKVTLPDGSVRPAELLGTDERRDIALLKIDAKGLPTLPKADLREAGQGTLVAIVGRSPDPRVPTLNLGILSALGRMNGTAVQTDAEMNYGNAGGALVTLKGDLVGVGAHVKPRAHWGQSGGIGFACKTSEIDKVLERLKRKERIPAEKIPFLGIAIGEGDPDASGLQVGRVEPGSSADKAGLKEGDVIVEFDGVPVVDFEDFRGALHSRKVGQEVAIKVRRPKDRARKEYEELRLKATLEGKVEE